MRRSVDRQAAAPHPASPDFTLPDARRQIRKQVRRLCARFGNDYWIEGDGTATLSLDDRTIRTWLRLYPAHRVGPEADSLGTITAPRSFRHTMGTCLHAGQKSALTT